jgi:hypothetical protein
MATVKMEEGEEAKQKLLSIILIGRILRNFIIYYIMVSSKLRRAGRVVVAIRGIRHSGRVGKL